MLRSKVSDMQVGDVLKLGCRSINSATYSAITKHGLNNMTELPYAPIINPNGFFYMKKVAKGLIVADRNIHLVSATTLDNNMMFYNGNPSQDLGINMTGATMVVNGLEYSKVINNETVVVSASSFYAVNYEAHRLLGATGGADGDRWLSNNDPTAEIVIDLGSRIPINGFSIQGSTVATAIPREFKVYVSDDRISWTEVAHITSNPGNTVMNSYNLAQQAIGRYIKFQLLANNGYAGNYKYEISDIKLFSNPFEVDGILRVLHGGSCYAKNKGGRGIVFDPQFGAYPVHNEWDRYIWKSSLDGTIVPGDDNEWHWSNKESWATGFPNEIMPGTYAYQRIVRGGTHVNKLAFGDSSSASTTFGYRPVLEYTEVTV